MHIRSAILFAAIPHCAQHHLEPPAASGKATLRPGLGNLHPCGVNQKPLGYDEPADWYYPPTRQALGAALLMQCYATEAERVFRDDLATNRRNGRSLFGLTEALKRQSRMDGAALARTQFQTA